MECRSYIKKEDIYENKEIFIYGFKHIKTDRSKKYKIIACDSDELYAKIKLFNFWSNKFKKMKK